MKIVSWNVNGIRAVAKKGFIDFIKQENPDILCLQETKAWPEQLDEELLAPDGYKSFFVSAEKKGYSGVAIYARENLNIKIIAEGLGNQKFDSEGRFIFAKVGDLEIHNIYFPSGTTGDIRQDFKYDFLDQVSDFYQQYPNAHNTIIVGDYNICHQEIDIHHPDRATKQQLSGFLPEERKWFSSFLDLGFTDTFRHFHPQQADTYSWWSYRAGARPKNLGWRIDYCLANQNLTDRLKNANILTEVMGSDHAPILLELEYV